MKISKIISVILVIALCLSFVGCAKNEEDTAPVTSVAPLAHSVNIVGYAETPLATILKTLRKPL